MNKQISLACLALLFTAFAMPAHSRTAASVWSPAPGVLCDRFMCANKQGISRLLTTKHLGGSTSEKLFSQGDVNLTQFTFANGVFCDVKEHVCRENRYFGADGKRSGAVSKRYTRLLFGK